MIDKISTSDGIEQAVPGGGPFNTARALARLGVPTAFLGRLSDDAFGRQLALQLVSDGASLELASIGAEPTTIAMANVDTGGSAKFRFLVDGTSAPNLTPDMVPDQFGPQVKAIHVGTLGLVLEPMASTLVDLIRREHGERLVLLDPNIRVGLRPDSEYRERLRTAISNSTVVKASVSDLAWLYTGIGYEEAAERILRDGVSLVVVTRGADGAFGAHRDTRIHIAAPQVEVVDTIGAGDAFGAGLLAWLHDQGLIRPGLSLERDEVEEALRFACLAGALTCARAGAEPPWKAEMLPVRELVRGSPRASKSTLGPMELTRAKLRQGADLMEKYGLDCWVVQFARETGLRSDPLGYLVGAAVTWPSAFLLNRDGRTAAIVGTGDSAQVEGTGLWDEVHGYVATPREDLVQVLDAWSPKTIGITWSASDDTADSITFGMYRMLESLLEGTPHAGRLVPAGELAGEVRRRKLPDEIEGIHSAITFTEQIFNRIEAHLQPGMTEKEVQRQIQDWVREAGFGFSWEEKIDPIVDFGPRTATLGHTLPGDQKLEPGHVIHVDLGIERAGFASDLQRTWYWLKDGETGAPEPVTRAFGALRAAIDAGMAVLKPGRAGHEVDAESRRTIIDAGYPEPGFAFGHHVGRVAHDGAGTLGPRWERYGSGPEVLIEPSNVFAVEMGLDVPGYGVVGLEEEAVVEDHGAHFLSNPQRELWLLPRRPR